MNMNFTHIDDHGDARMVDVSEKAVTRREAVATGRIRMSRDCFDAVCQGRAQKGDVLGTAQVAGIMAAKRTSELIPLCHLIPLTHCAVVFAPDEAACAIDVTCTVRCTGKTGVEMEALTGASVALLTVYDMCKAIDRAMEIQSVHLVEKHGGKSGDFFYAEASHA